VVVELTVRVASPVVVVEPGLTPSWAAARDSVIRALSISVDAVDRSIEPDARSDFTYEVNSESVLKTALALWALASARARATSVSKCCFCEAVSSGRVVAGRALVCAPAQPPTTSATLARSASNRTAGWRLRRAMLMYR
jgi:hypothetical protein